MEIPDVTWSLPILLEGKHRYNKNTRIRKEKVNHTQEPWIFKEG